MASSDRVRADDFDPGIMRQLFFPLRGLVALDAFGRFRPRSANGVAPSQFDATRSGKDQLIGHSIAGAPLYGRTRSLLELAGNALHGTLLRVVRSIRHPGIEASSPLPTNGASSSVPILVPLGCDGCAKPLA